MTNNSTSDSSESKPSGKNLASLTDRLKSGIQADAKAIRDVTQSELEQHRQNLQSLSKSVADTTLGDIKNQAALSLIETVGSMRTSAALAVTETVGTLKASAAQVQETYQAEGKKFSENLKAATKGLSQSAKNIQDTLKANEALIQKQAEQIKQIEAHSQTKAWKALQIKCWAAIGATAALCAAMLLASVFMVPWGLWGEPAKTEMMRNGKYLVMFGPNWTVCTLSNGQRHVCKRVGE